MLRSLLSPPLLLLLLLVLSFPSGNSAINVVERIMLASGLGETSEFVTRLSEAYAYTDKEVRIQYTAASGAEFALDLFETGRSDIAILPSAIPSDSDRASWAQIPLALYGIACVYNTNPPSPPNDFGEFGQFVLDGETTVGVWGGSIPSWQSEAMMNLNGYAQIPLGDIQLVVQGYDDPKDEAASITGVFGRYLASLDPSGIGAAYEAHGRMLAPTITSLNPNRTIIIPQPASGIATPQLTAEVLNVGGAMGYATWGTTVRSGIAYASVINRASNFLTKPIASSLQSALADFGEAMQPNDISSLVLDIVNGPSINSWPASGIIYAAIPLVVSDASDCSYINSMLTLLAWNQLNDASAQLVSASQEAFPLSVKFAHATLTTIASVTCKGGSAISTSLMIAGGRPSRLASILAESYDPTGSTIRVALSDLAQVDVIDQMSTGNIDFGIVDTASIATDLSRNITTLVPFAANAIVPSYNLPEIASGSLAFSPRTIASILDNVTTHWNDTVIANDNPRLAHLLPHAPIVFVLDQGGLIKRSGGPAGGFINQMMADYLERHVPGFNATLPGGGIAYTIQSIPGRHVQAGDAGVVRTLAATPYGIGFDAMSIVAESRTLPVGDIIQGGVRISATRSSIVETARLDLTKRATAGWPIVYWSHIYVPPSRDYGCPNLATFLKWVYWTQTNTLDVTARLSDSEGVVPAGQVSPDLATSLALSFRRVTCGGPTRTAFARSECMDDAGTMCSNHGTCVVPSARYTIGNATCDCQSGWEGVQCASAVKPTSAAASTNGDSELRLGLGLGIGLGVGVVLLLLFAFVCVLAALGVGIVRRKRERPAWDASISDIEFGDLIGTSGNGDIHKAKWRGTEVAVKTFAAHRTHFSRDELQKLRGEVDIMNSLRHPNVIAFYATCTKPPDLCIIMEHMELSSLFDLLENELVEYLPLALRVKLALGIAKGMHYIHSQGIVHRDLKSPNVLIDSKWNAKVADFGLSTARRAVGNEQAGLSIPWAAPEILSDSTTADGVLADIYSFGIILWEIITREKPYNGMSPAAIAVAVIRDQKRPVFDDVVPSPYLNAQDLVYEKEIAEMQDLTRRCWAQDVVERPTLPEIINALDIVASACAPEKRVDDSGSMTRGSSSGSNASSMRSIYGNVRPTAHGYGTTQPPPHDGDVYIVISDISGADRLWELNHSAACEATMIHNVLMRDLMATHNGYEVHMSGLKASMGAGTFCVAFRQAIDAVAWCSSAQRALVVADWPTGLLRINGAHAEYGNSSDEHFVYRGLRVRMGVHVGPVRRIMDPKTRCVEYIGLAVKGAMAIAHVSSGGQVLVSPDIKAELTDLPNEIGRMRPLWIQHMGNIDLEQVAPEGIAYQLIVNSLKMHAKNHVRFNEDDDDDCDVLQLPAEDMSLLVSANKCWWFIDPRKIETGKVIGRGMSAVVYRGLWSKLTLVAVKIFNRSKMTEEQAL